MSIECSLCGIDELVATGSTGGPCPFADRFYAFPNVRGPGVHLLRALAFLPVRRRSDGSPITSDWGRRSWHLSRHRSFGVGGRLDGLRSAKLGRVRVRFRMSHPRPYPARPRRPVQDLMWRLMWCTPHMCCGTSTRRRLIVAFERDSAARGVATRRRLLGSDSAAWASTPR
jgi:hypothetical protein